MRNVILLGEGIPIHSNCVDISFHRGSARDASFVLVASADVMALVLPNRLGIFFVGDDIGLALPTNLLGMDGLKQGGVISILIYGFILFSSFGASHSLGA